MHGSGRVILLHTTDLPLGAEMEDTDRSKKRSRLDTIRWVLAANRVDAFVHKVDIVRLGVGRNSGRRLA